MAKETYDNHYYIHTDNDGIKRCTICGRPYPGPGADHLTCVTKSGKTKIIESGMGWIYELLTRGKK